MWPKLKTLKSNTLFIRKVSVFYQKILSYTKIVVTLLTISLITISLINIDLIFNKIKLYTQKFGFIVQEIVIYGNDNISKDQLSDLLHKHIGTPIVGVDIFEIQKEIEKNPWVKRSFVERLYPNKIIVGILEKSPAANFKNKNKNFLIDISGNILSESKNSDLLTITGEEANLHFKFLKKYLDQYPSFRDKIKTAVLYGKRRWNFILENDLIIQMPEYKNMDSVMKYLNSKANFNEVKNLDLRNPNRFFVIKK